MVGAKEVLAALALSPAFAAAGALAQNGYSFTDAANSTVHYGAAPATPAMTCAAVRASPRQRPPSSPPAWCRRPTACPSIAA